MRLARTHKYYAKRCELDGYKFASQAEMRRYQELRLMEKAGAIRNLKLQPRYGLYAVSVGDKRMGDGMGAEWPESVKVADYIADFEYEEPYYQESWILITEDVKGVKTPLYRLKAKWFAACYDREIRETR